MNFPRTRFFNSSNAVVAVLFSWERNITKYFYLEEANRALQAENKRLREKVPNNFIAIDARTALVEDTLMELSYSYIPGEVINASFRFTNNYFTINSGSQRGIQPKMGVISSDGIVGIVYDVSERYAIIKSVLTSDINISAYDTESEALGLLKYDGTDPRRIQLIGVSNDIILKKGSEIKTMGSAGYFPKGIPVGVIEDFEIIEGKSLWNITVLLHQDMRRLNHVYVIENINQLELDNLQEKMKENE